MASDTTLRGPGSWSCGGPQIRLGGASLRTLTVLAGRFCVDRWNKRCADAKFKQMGTVRCPHGDLIGPAVADARRIWPQRGESDVRTHPTEEAKQLCRGEGKAWGLRLRERRAWGDYADGVADEKKRAPRTSVVQFGERGHEGYRDLWRWRHR